MQLQGLAQPVELHNVQQASSGFQIAMNAKAFRVLSSTIYQDKIGSIVRELSANAMDAHVMAGKPDTAFRMHFPDQFEPYFEVQDYGTGIAPDKIQSVFTVYFNSTKDQSNDVIGAFGLGSKTPFSYTDQFTVTNRFEGKQYIYSAFVAADGQPSLVLLEETETAECNGLCVSMSVKSEDYHKFAEAAKTQLRFLKQQPVYENAPYGFTVVDPFANANILAQANGFILAENKLQYNSAFAVQGQIGYVIDVSNLDNQNPAVKFLKHLLNFGSIKIDFNIGEIGVTASREAVEYTPETIKVIQDKIAAIQADLILSYQTKIKQHSTNWAIASEANSADMFSIGAGFASYFNNGSSQPDRYQGQWRFELPKGAWAIIKTYHGRRSEGNRYVVPSNKTTVYLQTQDCTYKQKRTTEIFSSVKPDEICVLIKFDANETTVAAIQKALGGSATIKMLSDVPVVITPSSRAPGVKSTAWKINKADIQKVKGWARETQDFEALLDDTCVVFPVAAYRETSVAIDNRLRDLEKYNQAFSDLTSKIYAVREKDYQEALDLGAKPLAQYVDELNAKAKETAKVIHRANLYAKLPSAADWYKNAQYQCGLSEDDFPKYVRKSARILQKLKTNWRSKIQAKVRNAYYVSIHFGSDLPDDDYNPVVKQAVKNLEEYKAKTPIFKMEAWHLKQHLTTEEIRSLMKVTFNNRKDDGNESW